eukprot:8376224-Pyramimonas_sp.AAC.2
MLTAHHIQVDNIGRDKKVTITPPAFTLGSVGLGVDAIIPGVDATGGGLGADAGAAEPATAAYLPRHAARHRHEGDAVGGQAGRLQPGVHEDAPHVGVQGQPGARPPPHPHLRAQHQLPGAHPPPLFSFIVSVTRFTSGVLSASLPLLAQEDP